MEFYRKQIHSSTVRAALADSDRVLIFIVFVSRDCPIKFTVRLHFCILFTHVLLKGKNIHRFPSNVYFQVEMLSHVNNAISKCPYLGIIKKNKEKHFSNESLPKKSIRKYEYGNFEIHSFISIFVILL